MDSRTFAFFGIALIVLVVYVEREPLPVSALTLDEAESTVSGELEIIDRAPAEPQSSGDHRIFGRVVDRGGDRLTGVRVIVESDFATTETVTDAGGGFGVAAGVDPGSRVTFRRKGFVAQSAPLHHIARYEEVVLDRGSVVMGVVTDARRRPVPGVEVRARSENGWKDRTDTDDLGRYHIWAPPGDLALSAHSSELGDRSGVRCSVAMGHGERVDIELRDGIELDFRVVDSSRVPVAGARVWLRSTEGDEELTVTDASGIATLRGIAGDRATVSIARAGHAEVIESLALRALAGEERRDYVLGPAAPWSFQVIGADLGPAEGAEVTFLRRGMEVMRTRAVDFDTLQIAAPGHTYDVVITAPGHCTLRARTDQVDRAHLTFHLDRGLRISGRVLDENGRGRSDVSVRIARHAGEGGRVPVATVLSNATGGFETEPLPAATYVVFWDGEEHVAELTTEDMEIR